MKLLSHDAFTLRSRLSVEELVARLEAFPVKAGMRFLPHPSKMFTMGRKPDAYRGENDATGFKISPDIHYGNSFLPVIEGRYEQTRDGVLVHVTQRLSRFTRAFSMFWLGGVVLIGGVILFSAIVDTEMDEAERLLVLALLPFMLGFFFFLQRWAFWMEARHTQPTLSAIFDADDVTAYLPTE